MSRRRARSPFTPLLVGLLLILGVVGTLLILGEMKRRHAWEQGCVAQGGTVEKNDGRAASQYRQVCMYHNHIVGVR